MKQWKKKMTAALLAVACIGGLAAATTTQKILYGAAALLFISNYYQRLDDHGGQQFLAECQQQTGVYDSAEADNRVQEIYRNLCDTGAVDRNYKVYVSPDEDINASMSLAACSA